MPVAVSVPVPVLPQVVLAVPQVVLTVPQVVLPQVTVGVPQVVLPQMTVGVPQVAVGVGMQVGVPTHDMDPGACTCLCVRRYLALSPVTVVSTRSLVS